MSAWNEV